MNQSRRTLIVATLGTLGGVAAMVLGRALGAQEMTEVKPISKLASKPVRDVVTKRRVIKIQAKKFNYTPNRIVLKKGDHVTLELTSIDFMHGFLIPDFKMRADIPPGQITTLQLNTDEEGEFIFLCDNFCGNGHEEMNGKIIVTA